MIGELTRDHVRAIRKRLDALYRATRTLGRILDSERIRDAASTISDAIDALEVLDERFREDALVRHILDLAGLYERDDDFKPFLRIEVTEDGGSILVPTSRGNKIYADGIGTPALEVARDELKKRIEKGIASARDSSRHEEQAWSLWAEKRLEQIQVVHHSEASP